MSFHFDRQNLKITLAASVVLGIILAGSDLLRNRQYAQPISFMYLSALATAGAGYKVNRVNLKGLSAELAESRDSFGLLSNQYDDLKLQVAQLEPLKVELFQTSQERDETVGRLLDALGDIETLQVMRNQALLEVDELREAHGRQIKEYEVIHTNLAGLLVDEAVLGVSTDLETLRETERNRCALEMQQLKETHRGQLEALKVKAEAAIATVQQKLEKTRHTFKVQLSYKVGLAEAETERILEQANQAIEMVRLEQQDLINRLQQDIRIKDQQLGVARAAKGFRGSSRAALNGNRLIEFLGSKGIVCDGLEARSESGTDILVLNPRTHAPEEVRALCSLMQLQFGLLSLPSVKVFETGLEVRFDCERTQTTSKSSSAKGSGLFENRLLTDRNSYPLLIITGKMGSGKTQVAQYLGALGGCTVPRYIINPHMKPKDFPGSQGYFGGGRRFWQEGDEIPSWSMVTQDPEQPWSIYQVLKAVEGEVDKRFKDYARGITDFQEFDLYIDETVAIKTYFGSHCPQRSLKATWSDFITLMFTEPRKVGIRVILLTQATTVKMLGLEGMADLRDEQTWIRLGETAIKYAKNLKLPEATLAAMQDQQKAWDDDTSRLSTAPVAMCNELAMSLPSLSDMIEVIGVSAQPVLDEDSERVRLLAAQGLKVSEIAFQVYGVKQSRSQAWKETRHKIETILR